MVTDANGEIALKDLTKGRYYLQETGYTANNDKGYMLNTTGKFYFDIDKNGKAVAATDPAITDTNKVSDASFTIDTTGTTLTRTTSPILKRPSPSATAPQIHMKPITVLAMTCSIP